MPLMSESASGKFQKNLFFQRKKSGVSVSFINKKFDPKTSSQISNRLAYKEACNLWNSKIAYSKNLYRDLAFGTKKSGYNVFLEQYLSGTLQNRLGMNFAHDIDFGADVVESEILADLAEIKSHGIRKIRVAMPTYNSSVAIEKLKQVCLYAKNAGFFVTWGLAVGDYPLTSLTLPDYYSAVLSLASWAELNKIDMFSLGNEIEINHDESISDFDIRNMLRSLASDVKLVYSHGPLIYTCVGNLDSDSADWISENNLGDIDILGVNVYVYNGDGFSWFWSIVHNASVAFAGRFCLTEFNLWGGDGWDYFNNLSETELAQKIFHTLDLLSDFPDIDLYFFCWRFPSDYWATKKANGELREWWRVLT